MIARTRTNPDTHDIEFCTAAAVRRARALHAGIGHRLLAFLVASTRVLYLVQNSADRESTRLRGIRPGQR